MGGGGVVGVGDGRVAGWWGRGVAGGGRGVEIEGLGDIDGAGEVAGQERAGNGGGGLGWGSGGGEAGVDVFVVDVAGVVAVVVGGGLVEVGGEFDGRNGRSEDGVDGLLGIDWWGAGAADGPGPGGAWGHV